VDGVALDGIEADVLIGADGVNGVTARRLGLGGNRVVGVALEANLPYAKMDRSAYDGRLALELGVVPGGYGWVFPKGDHANFGVGGWQEEGPRLRAHLRRLCEAHGASFDDLEELRGYRLPLREPGSTLARGRALLVGDAAGLIDPVSGQRDVQRLPSSQYASEAVLDVLQGRAGAWTLWARLRAGWRPPGPRGRQVASTATRGHIRPRQHSSCGAPSSGGAADVGESGVTTHPPLKAIRTLAAPRAPPGRLQTGLRAGMPDRRRDDSRKRAQRPTRLGRRRPDRIGGFQSLGFWSRWA
jgi:hypothetical protein